MWTDIPPFVLDQLFGYQSANMLRGNIITLGLRHVGRSLGGSRVIPLNVEWRASGLVSEHPGVGPHDAYDYWDVEIDGSEQNIIYAARIELRSSSVDTSVTPKIRNITDSVDIVVGEPCNAIETDYSGPNQRQVLPLVLTPGVKRYRLQLTLSNIDADIWAKGEVESYVPPPPSAIVAQPMRITP